jgi:hypothetical protein
MQIKLIILSIGLISGVFTNGQTPESKRVAEQVIDNVRQETISRANEMLDEKPVTVTASLCKRSAGGKHDFYSEGDYWWPDPPIPVARIFRKTAKQSGKFVDHRHAMIG